MNSPIDNMRNMLDSMKSVATKATEAPKDLMDIITGAFDRMVSGLTKVLNVSFISKLGSQSVFAQAESQGYAAKMVNEGASTLTARGGALAELITGESGLSITKMDFSKLASSAVEPMERIVSDIQSIPIEALGTLSPLITPGMGREQAMSLFA